MNGPRWGSDLSAFSLLHRRATWGTVARRHQDIDPFWRGGQSARTESKNSAPSRRSMHSKVLSGQSFEGRKDAMRHLADRLGDEHRISTRASSRNCCGCTGSIRSMAGSAFMAYGVVLETCSSFHVLRSLWLCRRKAKRCSVQFTEHRNHRISGCRSHRVERVRMALARQAIGRLF